MLQLKALEFRLVTKYDTEKGISWAWLQAMILERVAQYLCFHCILSLQWTIWPSNDRKNWLYSLRMERLLPLIINDIVMNDGIILDSKQIKEERRTLVLPSYFSSWFFSLLNLIFTYLVIVNYTKHCQNLSAQFSYAFPFDTVDTF